jgi:putative transposase
MVTAQGFPLSRSCATRRMQVLGLVSSQLPKHSYKKAVQPHINVPNRLNRQFDIDVANKVGAGDITYIWTGVHWAYLAVVLDLFIRHPVVWALSFSHDSVLTQKALMMSYESRGEPKWVMFRSDQGCQYTSLSFRQQL